MAERRTRAALLVAFALAGIAAPTGAAVAAEPVRLTVGVIGPIGALDLPSGNPVAREVWALQYPTLTTYSLDTLAVVPGLAEAWTPTDDGRGFVYTLRPATWSDGQPVTAEDVVSSLARAQEQRWSAGAFDHLEARAVDPRTVSVTTTTGLAALPAVPLHVLPAAGDVLDRSAGDWRVVQHDEASVRMAVVERPGRPALDEIVFRAYPDSTALMDALAGGQVDIATGFAPDDHDRVQAIDGATAIHASDGDQWVLQLRIDDADLRRAITYAIDREALVQAVVNGVGRPEAVPVVARPGDWRVPPDEARQLGQARAFSPERARELATAAEPVELTLAVADGEDDIGRAIATQVIDALRATGISVDAIANGSADITVARRDPTDDPSAVLSQYACTGGIWCDEEYDAAYAQFIATNDVEVRATAAHDMVRRIVSGVPEVVLFAPDGLQAFRPERIAGILRRPEQTRLVAFWPSVEQYREMHAAAPAASEELPESTYAALALGLSALVVAGVIVVDRRFVHPRR